MPNNALSAETFERFARLHCRRWEARSLEVVRALLVESKRVTDVASQFGMKPQQAVVLRTRFLDRMREKGAVKVPATEFMQSVMPPNASPLDPFRDDLKQLVEHRYSVEQIKEYLQRNDLQVSEIELTAFLEALNGTTHEDANVREPKGRRR